MKQLSWAALVIFFVTATFALTARAEMLAIVVYETKAEESIRALRVEGADRPREDGLAIIDVDPASEAYGKILTKIPLPPGWVPHHQYYNRDKTKIYVGTESREGLHVIDLTRVPWRVKRVDTPGCARTDAMIFSADGKTWWVTCMGTNNLFVGDALTDEVVGEIFVPAAGPHGMDLDESIDRILVTNTLVSPQPMVFGENVTVIEASTGAVLSTHKLSRAPSPSGAGPVEVLFIRGSNPPLAYVTVWLDGAEKKAFFGPRVGTPRRGSLRSMTCSISRPPSAATRSRWRMTSPGTGFMSPQSTRAISISSTSAKTV